MKIILFTFVLIFPVISIGAPCKGAPGKNHINSDSSVGGFVANTASVSKSVFIDSTSSICEQATIQGNAQIRNGSEVSGSAVIEGNAYLNSSRVKGIAKVYGGAVVTNSSICQASLINFNVSDSDYYCDVEDEPKDPGELGKKTILGIDSNVNGIRDDVEIWINNKTSNTPDKDMYNIRMALRQIAKGLQSAMKFKDNKPDARRFMLESILGVSCLKNISYNKDLEGLDTDMNLIIISSEQRFFAWARAQASLSGLPLNLEKKRNCLFEKR